jgi:hypothetical protein
VVRESIVSLYLLLKLLRRVLLGWTGQAGNLLVILSGVNLGCNRLGVVRLQNGIRL